MPSITAKKLSSTWSSVEQTRSSIDTRSFHTATPTPIDTDARSLRTPSPFPRSNTSSPAIPQRSPSRLLLQRANTSMGVSRRKASPIPSHLHISTQAVPNTDAQTGIQTRSPSRRSHTPFPYLVSHEMERTDSGFEDGHTRSPRSCIGSARASAKGRRSPLSVEHKENTSEQNAEAGSPKPKASRKSSHRRSLETKTFNIHRSTPGQIRQSSPTSSSSEPRPKGRALQHSSTASAGKPPTRKSIARSQSYHISTSRKPCNSYDMSSTVEEVRLSNLRQRHCFYQFPPLPSSPLSGEYEYRHHPTRNSLDTQRANGSSYTTTTNEGSEMTSFNTSRIRDTFTPTYRTHTLSLPPTSHVSPMATPSPSPSPDDSHHNHPPPTTLYFLSDETRRMEYAAIDAASKGIRGLVSRLVPDCMLPKPSRGGFHHEGTEGDSDSGSVRRYRLPDLVVLEDNGDGKEECVVSGLGMGDSGEKEGKKERGWRRFVPGFRISKR